MFFLLAFVLCTVPVQGTPLEITFKSFPFDLSTLGVDIGFCKTLVYQVKACEDHGLGMFDYDGTVVMEWKISSWFNGKTRLHIQFPQFRYVDAGYPNLLYCDRFRWLWIRWANGRIKFGRGPEPEVNTMLDTETSAVNHIKKLKSILINNNYNVTLKLGESGKDRFTRVLEGGKFTDGMISETSTSLGSCASLCSEHVNCGMFSFNGDLELCAVFDRMNSTFALTSGVGWISWKMLYCHP